MIRTVFIDTEPWLFLTGIFRQTLVPESDCDTDCPW